MTYSLRLPYRKIQVPTLILWGEEDAFLEKNMAQQSLRYCGNGKLTFIKNAGHWVHHQKPEEIISLIARF